MKLLKLLIIIMTILILLGCSMVNERTANKVIKELNEIYDEEFEVVALGKRFGTKNNDTVTVYVKDKQETVFTVIMNTKGVITSENYLYKKLGKDLVNVLKNGLKEVGVESEGKLTVVGGEKLEREDATIAIQDYVESHKPEYFIGDIIIKEDTNFKVEDLVQPYELTYDYFKKTRFMTRIWIISSEEYEEAVEDFNQNPSVSMTWYEKYNVIEKYYIDMGHEGIEIEQK